MVDEWNVSLFAAKYIALIQKLNAQNRWNRAVAEQLWRKTKQPGGGELPRAATMGSPWWCLSWPSSFFFLFLVSYCIAFTRGICYTMPILGHFGRFNFLLWSSRPQNNLLLFWFGLVNLKSAKTLKTSKTMHNRRNKAINHIAIHFKPLKWLLNT